MSLLRTFYAGPALRVVASLSALTLVAPGVARADDDFGGPNDDPFRSCTFIINCDLLTDTVTNDSGPGGPSGDGPRQDAAYQERTWKYEHTDDAGRAWYRNTADGQENVWKSTPDAIPYTKLGFKTSESIIDAARAGDR